ncbi:MAG: hypothetical protein GYA55_12045 [SAR324 cluster bacterium]|uniref:Uncharacterized protein n=1 Tax=SAR324 cluster bacterium TaxID=2024889 RepID=A0A7X9IMC5_9DELT|nr:hypothetical protein [SAR324 cluster bacterium]
MGNTFINDIYLTNSIVNFLYAGYQGAFAAQNLLSQLGYKNIDPGEISLIETKLTEIERWKEDLLKGLPIFSSTWKAPQTVASKKAFQTLSELRSDLLKTVGHIKKSLLAEDLAESKEEVKYLIAAFSRQAYSRENYVRGFIEFGESFKHQDVVDNYTKFLPQAEQGLQAAHMFLQIFQSEEKPQAVFFKGLYEECIFLPGVFQAQVHDINILLNSYTEVITYEKLGIIPEHIDSWESIKVNATAAGYWQAWDFTPELAANWLEAQFNDPRSAWFWLNMGFDPGDAREWALAGFFPPAAREWRERGYSLEATLKFLEDQSVRQQVQQRAEAEDKDEWAQLKRSKESESETNQNLLNEKGEPEDS